MDAGLDIMWSYYLRGTKRERKFLGTHGIIWLERLETLLDRAMEVVGR
jgi:hypothetical protein